MKFAFARPVWCSAGSFLSVLNFESEINMDVYMEASQVDVVQQNSDKITADGVKLLIEFLLKLEDVC